MLVNLDRQKSKNRTSSTIQYYKPLNLCNAWHVKESDSSVKVLDGVFLFFFLFLFFYIFLDLAIWQLIFLAQNDE